MNRYALYEKLDIYGESGEDIHHELKELYQIYTTIGGYPAVVLQYMESHSLSKCEAVLLKIIKLFIQESKRYFDDILEDEIYQNIFSCVARILVKEKKGFSENSFSEELRSIATKDYSSNISKASVNRAIDWLYSAGIIGFAGKVSECNILDFKAKARCYFMDMGVIRYYLEHIGCSKGDISGIINENFVYLDLKRRLGYPSEIALETPAFATLGNGEIDFFVMTMHTQKTYAVEVKTGKNNSKPIQDVLDKKKSDYILFVKGDTYGRIKDNMLTIPIYGISKFNF